MNKASYHLELITPCFAGGADPQKQAEIRVPAIRGQLRWWFRTLGGFASLKGTPVREQEAMVFGATAGDSGRASPLIVRLARPVVSAEVKDAKGLGLDLNSPKGYLLFPLRQQSRGVFNQTLPAFELCTVWRGPAPMWPDIQALFAVFGHLGSLGFRSRRAMGALAFAHDAPDLAAALKRFGRPADLQIRRQDATSAEDAISGLARWLKDWRAHGRSVDHATAKPMNPPHNSGFRFAKSDHDRGVAVLTRQGRETDTTFRPAIGLPIVQFFSSARQTINWEQGSGRQDDSKGRFASPVLLRPHRDAQGRWHALVLFVDAHKWPVDKPVYLNGQPRRVSLDLYEAMKRDPALAPFSP